MTGIIRAVCSSPEKGTRKKDVGKGVLIAGHGLEGDAHAGPGHRQLSLLAVESIAKMREKGLDVQAGDFAENLTVEGLDLVSLPIGTRLKIGPQAEVEVTQIGKECHSQCAIRRETGDCIMPREGIFVRITKGGPVQVGDKVEILRRKDAQDHPRETY